MPSYPTRKTKQGTVVDVRFRIIDDSGQEVQKRLCGYPTKKAAQQAYIEFMKSYTPPVFKLKKDGAFVYDDLLAQYKKRMQVELAASSFYDLNFIFDKFITPCFHGKSIPTLVKADLANWQTELWAAKNPSSGELYAQRYLTKIRSTLSGFLSWCEETYDVPNYLRNIRKPKRKEMKQEMQIWELDEFLRFQQKIDNIFWKTFYMSLFYSGCRIGELLALTDGDVSCTDGVYYFNINKNLTRKTLDTNNKYLIQPPKTATSNRTIPLPHEMTEQLTEYIEYKKANGIGSAFFFGGDGPVAEMTYSRYFNRYAEAAGLKHIRIHDLRHSHASLLIHLNVPITVISKRLGHSNIEMTLKKYAHCYASGAGEAVVAVDNAIANINCGTARGTNLEKTIQN